MFAQKFEQAREYAVHRLERELSPNLLYHGFAHTRDDVVQSANLLADMEGIQGESRYLLLTVAWFHDIGFVQQSADHELIGARIASEVLPGFGYTDEQVEIVRGAILATIIPQTPTNILEKIVADADLNVLGREDFILRNGVLRREPAFFGKVYSDFEWYAGQIQFAEMHTFFTASARALWNAAKVKNLANLKHALEALSEKE